MSESTAFDEAIEEGEIRGEIRGEIKGAIATSHKALLLLGRKQFGSPDEPIETELKSIRDLDRLERLFHAILAVKSWQELLATP